MSLETLTANSLARDIVIVTPALDAKSFVFCQILGCLTASR